MFADCTGRAVPKKVTRLGRCNPSSNADPPPPVLDPAVDRRCADRPGQTVAVQDGERDRDARGQSQEPARHPEEETNDAKQHQHNDRDEHTRDDGGDQVLRVRLIDRVPNPIDPAVELEQRRPSRSGGWFVHHSCFSIRPHCSVYVSRQIPVSPPYPRCGNR
jgi:hypothetical protein